MTEWDSTLETGDPLVDQQHRRIHKILQDLEAAEDTPGEVMHVLDNLTGHVAVHFATEEDLMVREEFSARDADLHRVEHQRLTKSTREYVLSFREGSLSSTGPLVEFLRDWLGNHVEKCDRQLIDYVRSRGGAAKVPAEYAEASSLDGLAL